MGMMANFIAGTDGSVLSEKTGTPLIQISPNPASHHTAITFPALEKNETLVIADEKGNMIFKESLALGSSRYEADISHLASGAYKILIGTEWANLAVVR